MVLPVKVLNGVGPRSNWLVLVQVPQLSMIITVTELEL